ncbi:hypothetical protein [Bosea rubneri]|uniref:Uncharacterized protein n=1 Tax=Bosea rubneri TaxID=3075434 RepID=A0ABU3SER2_9HYPH|nr:hypothetical protein [Bosea sp. ZW T0_25]MDU0343176.1 hypothetical protein [Bosea sp. ZW T0_25]
MPAVNLAPSSSRPPAAFSAEAPLPTISLVQLGRALETLLSVANSLTNCPRFVDDNGRMTEGGRRFDKTVGAICDEYLAVMDELRDSRPRNSSEAEDRSCELLKFDLNCDQDTTDIALGAVRRAFPGRY